MVPQVRGPQGYDVGQRLLVILPEGSLADATVVSKAGEGGRALKLQLSDGREVELELHTGNHCLQRLASAIAYRSAAASFGEHLAKITGTVEDGASYPSPEKSRIKCLRRFALLMPDEPLSGFAQASRALDCARGTNCSPSA